MSVGCRALTDSSTLLPFPEKLVSNGVFFLFEDLAVHPPKPEKLTCSRFSLCQCVVAVRISYTNLHWFSFPVLFEVMCL